MTASDFWGFLAILCFVSIPVALAHLYAPPRFKPLALLRALSDRIGDRMQNRHKAPTGPPPLPSSMPSFPGMPEREPGEGPATAKQRDYLRHLAQIDESELSKLGKWQASWLIDSILASRKETSAPSEKGGCTIGCTPFAIAGAVLVCWWAWKSIAAAF